MASVLLGAAALSTALVGGYGLYKYLTQTTRSATDDVPPPSVRAPPPVPPKPSTRAPPVPPKPSTHKLKSPPLTLGDEPASFDQVGSSPCHTSFIFHPPTAPPAASSELPLT